MDRIEQTVQEEETPLEAGRYVRKVTWVGLGVNLALSGFKFVAGILGHSQAVVADAVHSLSDTVTDVAVLVGSHYWSSPPDEGHPYGHRRIETLVSSFIGVMIVAAGAGIGWQAMATYRQAHTAPPGWIAFWAALASIACKEALYQWTALAGRRVRSPALTANAWHHRQDAFSSAPVMLAVGSAIVVPAWSFLDHVGAALVAVIIVGSGLKFLWQGITEFLDAGASEAECEEIRRIACRNESVIEAHEIRTRTVAASLRVDMHVVVDGSITVREGHDIATDIKRRLLCEGPDVVDVVVHIEPTEEALQGDDRSAEAEKPQEGGGTPDGGGPPKTE